MSENAVIQFSIGPDASPTTKFPKNFDDGHRPMFNSAMDDISDAISKAPVIPSGSYACGGCFAVAGLMLGFLLGFLLSFLGGAKEEMGMLSAGLVFVGWFVISFPVGCWAMNGMSNKKKIDGKAAYEEVKAALPAINQRCAPWMHFTAINYAEVGPKVEIVAGKNGQPYAGSKNMAMQGQVAYPQPGQALMGQPIIGQPMQGQPMMGQPMQGQPMMGQPMQGQPMMGQPMMGHPMQGQPMMGQPMMAQPMQGQHMMGHPMDQAMGQPMGYNGGMMGAPAPVRPAPMPEQEPPPSYAAPAYDEPIDSASTLCSGCKSPNAPGSTFCNRCGSKL